MTGVKFFEKIFFEFFFVHRFFLPTLPTSLCVRISIFLLHYLFSCLYISSLFFSLSVLTLCLFFPSVILFFCAIPCVSFPHVFLPLVFPFIFISLLPFQLLLFPLFYIQPLCSPLPLKFLFVSVILCLFHTLFIFCTFLSFFHLYFFIFSSLLLLSEPFYPFLAFFSCSSPRLSFPQDSFLLFSFSVSLYSHPFSLLLSFRSPFNYLCLSPLVPFLPLPFSLTVFPPPLVFIPLLFFQSKHFPLLHIQHSVASVLSPFFLSFFSSPPVIPPIFPLFCPSLFPFPLVSFPVLSKIFNQIHIFPLTFFSFYSLSLCSFLFVFFLVFHSIFLLVCLSFFCVSRCTFFLLCLFIQSSLCQVSFPLFSFSNLLFPRPLFISCVFSLPFFCLFPFVLYSPSFSLIFFLHLYLFSSLSSHLCISPPLYFSHSVFSMSFSSSSHFHSFSPFQSPFFP